MSLEKSWDLRVDPAVLKILQKISPRDAGVILDVIKLLPTNPYFGDVQKMKGESDTWRRRIGSYRIFYKIKVAEKTILVFLLERRTSSTY